MCIYFGQESFIFIIFLIKVGQISLASSFPEKYSLPDVAKQVAARNALAILKKKCSSTNIPVTQDMAVVAKRLELV